ncbi:MAG: Regulatory protein Spx [Pseudomonadota bacterium]
MKYTAIVVYGIPNCDNVKKARTWLTDQGYDHVFHDFKKQGLSEKALDHWLNVAGWEKVLNRKGTSWRKITPEEQASVINSATARLYLLANPSLIKRPVIEWHQNKVVEITIGFQPEQWLAR